MNPWYLPSIPTALLSFSDVCQSLRDLFKEMEVKGRDSLAKAAQYSLVLTLELDFNSKEEKLFNECTDSIVKNDPKKFCMNEIVTLSSFSLWTEKEVDSLCAAVAT